MRQSKLKCNFLKIKNNIGIKNRKEGNSCSIENVSLTSEDARAPAFSVLH